MRNFLATLAWLVVATAVVYVFVLSDRRRDWLVDVACGVFEQFRLLALDLKGYESEM